MMRRPLLPGAQQTNQTEKAIGGHHEEKSRVGSFDHPLNGGAGIDAGSSQATGP